MPRTLHATSSVSGNAATPANALGAQNSSFTTDSGDIDWTHRWGFTSEVGGSFTTDHTFAGNVRISGGTTAANATVNIYANGNLVGSSSFSVTTVSNQPFSLSVPRASIAPGNTVEVELVTSTGGGKPANRAAVQVDNFDWTTEHAIGSPSKLKVYNGTWNEDKFSADIGSGFQEYPSRYWNGSAWIDI